MSIPQLRAAPWHLDELDPFVCLLKTGGYLYFDVQYDIVAANSITFDQVRDGSSALYLGMASDLSPMSIDPLFEV